MPPLPQSADFAIRSSNDDPREKALRDAVYRAIALVHP